MHIPHNVTMKFDPLLVHKGKVEKSRQRRSRPFAVLTYREHALRAKRAAALLDGLFRPFPPVPDSGLLTRIYEPTE